VITDRLGSVRRGGAYASEKATYYPFGEQRTPGMNVSNQTAFATYQRDVGYGGTLDYAMNRYYAAQWGRFTTPDPYQASAQLANPQSWNRYSYVENDPVNKYDPEGLCYVWAPTPGYGPVFGCPQLAGTGPVPPMHELYGQGNAYGIPDRGPLYSSPGSGELDLAYLKYIQSIPWPELKGLPQFRWLVLVGAGIEGLRTVLSIVRKVSEEDAAADRTECEKLGAPPDTWGTPPQGDGWEWKGPGPVGSPGGGAWHRPGTGESARPADPDGQHDRRHWDYKGPNGTRWWVWPDGHCERKPSPPVEPPKP
jgi:RHS repeat-associated protein